MMHGWLILCLTFRVVLRQFTVHNSRQTDLSPLCLAKAVVIMRLRHKQQHLDKMLADRPPAALQPIEYHGLQIDKLYNLKLFQTQTHKC